MKNALLVGFVAAGFFAAAGTASAQYHVASSQAVGVPLEEFVPELDRAVTDVYDSLTGPYAAFAVSGGVLGVDDYTTTVADPTFRLAQFMFAGGVTTAGQQLRVNFYNTSNTLVNFFTVNLQLGGSNQIWTITLGITSDGSDSIFEIPSAGRVEIVAQGGATGRFWLTTTAPTIGSNDISWGGVPDSHYHVFGMRAVEVPAPAGLALLGFAGLAGARRRRA